MKETNTYVKCKKFDVMENETNEIHRITKIIQCYGNCKKIGCLEIREEEAD